MTNQLRKKEGVISAYYDPECKGSYYFYMDYHPEGSSLEWNNIGFVDSDHFPLSEQCIRITFSGWRWGEFRSLIQHKRCGDGWRDEGPRRRLGVGFDRGHEINDPTSFKPIGRHRFDFDEVDINEYQYWGGAERAFPCNDRVGDSCDVVCPYGEVTRIDDGLFLFSISPIIL